MDKMNEMNRYRDEVLVILARLLYTTLNNDLSQYKV